MCFPSVIGTPAPMLEAAEKWYDDSPGRRRQAAIDPDVR
jgi:hypothetical protein